MKIGNKLKFTLAAVVLAGIGALLFWGFLKGRKEPVMEKEREGYVQVPSRLPEGEMILTLDRETQMKSGVVVAPLKPMIHREEFHAYGLILDIQSLIDLRRTLIDLSRGLIEAHNRYAATRAQVEKTRVNLEALNRQYARAKVLYEENQNVSAKAFQEAEAAWRSAEADFKAAQEALRASQKSIGAAEEAREALLDSVRQQWGQVLTKWLSDNTPAFEQLVRQQTRLIQITLPSGIIISAGPPSVQVQTASGQTIPAKLVSASPHTDARIQGLSFFYIAPAQAGLLAGMNVTAYGPAGPKVKGIFIPDSALVWWHGKAWAYLQKDNTHFVRREVQTANPVRDGYLVMKGFSTADRVVVRGAQILLSLEFKPRTKGAEEKGDTD